MDYFYNVLVKSKFQKLNQNIAWAYKKRFFYLRPKFLFLMNPVPLNPMWEEVDQRSFYKGTVHSKIS